MLNCSLLNWLGAQLYAHQSNCLQIISLLIQLNQLLQVRDKSETTYVIYSRGRVLEPAAPPLAGISCKRPDVYPSNFTMNVQGKCSKETVVIRQNSSLA